MVAALTWGHLALMTSESPKYQVHGKPASMFGTESLCFKEQNKTSGPKFFLQGPPPFPLLNQSFLCPGCLSMHREGPDKESHNPLHLSLLSLETGTRETGSGNCTVPRAGLASASSCGTHSLSLPQACLSICPSSFFPSRQHTQFTHPPALGSPKLEL